MKLVLRSIGVIVSGKVIYHFLKGLLKRQRRRNKLLSLFQRALHSCLRAGLPRKPKMPQESMIKLTEECPYEKDWPWRLVVLIARLIEIPINKLRGVSTPNEPHLFSVALVIILAFDVVPLIAATVKGVITPDTVKVDVPLSKDYFGLMIAVVFPLVAAIAFSFYRKVFAIFDKLQSDGVLVETQPGILSGFKRNLNRRFNSLLPQPVFMAIVLFIIYYWWLGIIAEPRRGWLGELPLGVQAWVALWVFLALFSLLFFAWKSIYVWLSIRRLTRFSDGFAFHIQDTHPDGCGGLKSISSFWLHTHYMIVLVGLYVFGFAAFFDQWINPAVVLGILLYVVLAPTLLVGPFLPIHSKMVKYRDEKVRSMAELMEKAEEAVKQKTRSPQSIAEDMGILLATAGFRRKSYEIAKRLPTWPFNVGIWGKFLASYCVPFLIVGIDLLVRG